MPSIYSDSDGIAEIDSLQASTISTAVEHYYCDSNAADDSGDGLSWATAKKTLSGLSSLLPAILRHVAVIHGYGTHAGQNLVLESYCADGGGIMVSGDAPPGTAGVTDGYEIVSGPHDADIGSTTSVGNSGLSLTTDQYRPYAVEISADDFATIAERRQIQSHTATTFTPCKNFAASTSGKKFRVVRPTWTLGASSFIIPGVSFSGSIWIQRLRLNGGRFSSSPISNLTLGAIAIESGTSSQTIGAGSINVLSTGEFNPDTLSQNFSTHAYGIGSAATSDCVFRAPSTILLSGVNAPAALCEGSLDLAHIYQGSRFGKLVAQNCLQRSVYAIQSSSGYATTKISNASGIGIEVINSRVNIGTVDISSCSSHGVKVHPQAVAYFSGIATGTGNGGAGCQVQRAGAIVCSATPTLTGTVGNITADGTTQAALWATVAAEADDTFAPGPGASTLSVCGAKATIGASAQLDDLPPFRLAEPMMLDYGSLALGVAPGGSDTCTVTISDGTNSQTIVATGAAASAGLTASTTVFRANTDINVTIARTGSSAAAARVMLRFRQRNDQLLVAA